MCWTGPGRSPRTANPRGSPDANGPSCIRFDPRRSSPGTAGTSIGSWQGRAASAGTRRSRRPPATVLSGYAGASGQRQARVRTRGLADSVFADRLRGMPFVIDRVDLLGYVASDACMQDDAPGTLSVPLASGAAYYFQETVSDGCAKPLALAVWESGHNLAIRDGADLQPYLVAEAQVYAAGRLQQRVLESEAEPPCRSEVVCTAADVLALRGPDGRRPQGSQAGRSRFALTSQVSDTGSSA